MCARHRTQAYARVPRVQHPYHGHTAARCTLAVGLGARTLRIDLEGHGREALFEGIDPSRTLGWFTTMFPVVLDAGENKGPGILLKDIKEQLRRVPNRGLGHGLLRYMSGDAAIAESLRPQLPVELDKLPGHSMVSRRPFQGGPRESTDRLDIRKVAGDP